MEEVIHQWQPNIWSFLCFLIADVMQSEAWSFHHLTFMPG